MRESGLRKLVLVVIASALMAALVRVLRGGPAPQFTVLHDAPGGPRPVLIPAAADPTVAASSAAPVAERLTLVPGGAEPVNDPAEQPSQGELELVPAIAAAPTPTPESSRTWAEPIDGSCPPGFPVKAKLTSGIFHVPGGLSYDRTSPDRCYATSADAEADGLRAAKR